MKLFSSTLTISLLFAGALRADEAAEKLVQSSFKLFNSGSTATCLVVETEGKDDAVTRYIATANHVLANMKGETCLLVSRTAKPDGSYARKDIKIVIRKGDKDLWTKHGKHDLAIMKLPEGIDVKGLPLDALATVKQMKKVHTGDEVRLAVFPERTEANGAGFPILRGGSIASHPILPHSIHSVILLDATSWTGDSGGPVMHESLRAPGGGPVVIAFVRGLKRITDTEKESRFVERVTHYPLHVTETLHAVFVREMIETDSGEN